MFYVMKDYNKVRGTDAWKNMSPQACELAMKYSSMWGVNWKI